MAVKLEIGKEELEDLYIRQKLAMRKCAKCFNCDPTTIMNKLRAFDIPSRNLNESHTGKRKLSIYIDKKKLYNSYIRKGMSTKKCAENFECSQGVIYKRLKQFNISTRNLSESHKGQVSCNKGKKGEGMSNYGKHHTEETKRKMREAMIGEKNHRFGTHPSKETREKLSQSRSGEKSSNWKGGITPLIIKIRNCFQYRLWRSDVFTRDDFTCQKCNKRGGKLNAHHIEPFAYIMELNDIKTFKQAIDCEEFWNINNGITYCRECHNLIKR